jgi:hypothetical protein
LSVAARNVNAQCEPVSFPPFYQLPFNYDEMMKMMKNGTAFNDDEMMKMMKDGTAI